MTLKLHQEGKTKAPSSEDERKEMILITDTLIIHLGMSLITVHSNFKGVMNQFSNDPKVELMEYQNNLLGLQEGIRNEKFIRATFNIGTNFLFQGIAWDLVGNTDAQTYQVWARIYNQIGFLESA